MLQQRTLFVLGGETCRQTCGDSEPLKTLWTCCFKVPRHVVMIDVPARETVHHIDTKAKLDSEWLPPFNGCSEFNMVGHVVVYMPCCQWASEKSSPARRGLCCTRRGPGATKQMQYHENLSMETKTISDRFFSAKHYAPRPQQMVRCLRRVRGSDERQRA